jgi:1-phosphofructokinase family hexose kinase
MAARSDPGFVAVSTNPAIDRVAKIDGAAAGIVHATELLETPGGKAVHAACVASQLGADSAVITTVGGRSGGLLLDLLAAEPLDVIEVRVAGATRGTYTIVGAEGRDLVEVHEPSGSLTEAECARLVAGLAGLASPPRAVAVCGSLPPGAPTDLHARLIEAARGLGAFAILDCSTPNALAAALAEGPDLVAPNLAEAGMLVGSALDSGLSDAELGAITGAIRERGAGAVWLSMGAEGSVLATGEGSFRLTAPAPEPIVNAVGGGDALIGGLAAGLIAGRDLRSAAVLGAASATQKLAHLNPGRVDRAAVEALVPMVDATRLQPSVAVR